MPWSPACVQRKHVTGRCAAQPSRPRRLAQASEGSAVLAVGVASAVLVAASVKVVRLFLDRCLAGQPPGASRYRGPPVEILPQGGASVSEDVTTQDEYPDADRAAVEQEAAPSARVPLSKRPDRVGGVGIHRRQRPARPHHASTRANSWASRRWRCTATSRARRTSSTQWWSTSWRACAPTRSSSTRRRTGGRTSCSVWPTVSGGWLSPIPKAFPLVASRPAGGALAAPAAAQPGRGWRHSCPGSSTRASVTRPPSRPIAPTPASSSATCCSRSPCTGPTSAPSTSLTTRPATPGLAEYPDGRAAARAAVRGPLGRRVRGGTRGPARSHDHHSQRARSTADRRSDLLRPP